MLPMIVLDVTLFDNPSYEISQTQLMMHEIGDITFSLTAYSFGAVGSITAASAFLAAGNPLGAALSVVGAAASIDGMIVSLIQLSELLKSGQPAPNGSLEQATDIIDKVTDAIPLLVSVIEYFVSSGHLGEKATALARTAIEMAEKATNSKSIVEKIVACGEFLKAVKEFFTELLSGSSEKESKGTSDTDAGHSNSDGVHTPASFGDPNIGYAQPDI